MPRRPAGSFVPADAITFDSEAIYQAVEKKAQAVVNKVGRMAASSARERAPVRKVFSGGRRPAHRFYSLAEAKMELPAFLRSTGRSGHLTVDDLTHAGRQDEHMSSHEALQQLRSTKIATGRNRANSWRNTGARPHHIPAIGPFLHVDRDVGLTAKGDFYLMKPGAEYGLTTRGRYELRKGRALSVEAHTTRETGSEGTLGGSLRRSIELQSRSTGAVLKVSIVAGGEDAPYARFVEFGTRHAAAQPYLRPALKHVEGPFKSMMRQAFPGSR